MTKAGVEWLLVALLLPLPPLCDVALSQLGPSAGMVTALGQDTSPGWDSETQGGT